MTATMGTIVELVFDWQAISGSIYSSTLAEMASLCVESIISSLQKIEGSLILYSKRWHIPY